MDTSTARIRALEIAIENAPNGAKWDAILENADRDGEVGPWR